MENKPDEHKLYFQKVKGGVVLHIEGEGGTVETALTTAQAVDFFKAVILDKKTTIEASKNSIQIEPAETENSGDRVISVQATGSSKAVTFLWEDNEQNTDRLNMMFHRAAVESDKTEV